MEFIHINEHRVNLLTSAPTSVPEDGFLWIDLLHNEPSKYWRADIEKIIGVHLDDLHIADVDNLQHPSYFDSTSHYQMIIFRGLAPLQKHHDLAHEGLLDKAINIRTRPNVFLIFERVLITIHAPDSRTFATQRQRLLTPSSSQSLRVPLSTQDLTIRLLNILIDRYLELREPLTNQLERWQRELLDLDSKFTHWRELLEARIQLRRLENLCEEQYDAIQEWRDEYLEFTDYQNHHGPHRLVSDAMMVRVNDLIEHIRRVMNHAKRLEDAVESAVQLHFSATSHRTSEIMRILTVLTAIFLPLNLITGIFGMNFEFIPGIHTQGGFWIAIGIMLLIALGLVTTFRIKNFLSSRDKLETK
jgi:magnesium transporter